VIEIEKYGKAGRRGARLHKVTFTLDFLALQGLKHVFSLNADYFEPQRRKRFLINIIVG